VPGIKLKALWHESILEPWSCWHFALRMELKQTKIISNNVFIVYEIIKQALQDRHDGSACFGLNICLLAD